MSESVFNCPVCGYPLVHQGTLRSRKVQTWTCGGVNQTHEVILRLRGKALKESDGMNSTFLVQVTGIVAIGLVIIHTTILVFLGIFWGFQSSQILSNPSAYRLFMEALRTGLIGLGLAIGIGCISSLLYWGTVKKEKGS